MEGTVTKSTGSWYHVLTDDGKVWMARTRGKMRLTDLDTSNPVAVGDRVELMEDANYPDTASISQVYHRQNYLIRRANKLSSRRQILASNLDGAALIASLTSPRTSLGFIDRFILTCEAYHVPAMVFFNKMDLLGERGEAVINDIKDIYRNRATGNEQLDVEIEGMTITWSLAQIEITEENDTPPSECHSHSRTRA